MTLGGGAMRGLGGGGGGRGGGEACGPAAAGGIGRRLPVSQDSGWRHALPPLPLPPESEPEPAPFFFSRSGSLPLVVEATGGALLLSPGATTGAKGTRSALTMTSGTSLLRSPPALLLKPPSTTLLPLPPLLLRATTSDPAACLRKTFRIQRSEGSYRSATSSLLLAGLSPPRPPRLSAV